MTKPYQDHLAVGDVIQALEKNPTRPPIEELDEGIRPLIQYLWDRNIFTYQSCSGHASAASHPSACVWIEQGALDDNLAKALSGTGTVEQVALLYGREKVPVWEIVFPGETLPEQFRLACKAIRQFTRSPNKRIAQNLEEKIWQPIETAPRKKEVLVWRDDSGPLIAMLICPAELDVEDPAARADETDVWFAVGYGEWLEGPEKPTHWMALPEGPDDGHEK
jgi:hypothetical protein